MTRKPILCLDFDGVLHSYTSGWQGADVIPDDPVPGMLDFLQRAVEAFHVCIFSSRSNEEDGIYAMQDWLRGCGASEQLLDQIEFPTEKPPAMVTLDDRAITFDGTWPTIDALLAFEPWFKRRVPA